MVLKSKKDLPFEGGNTSPESLVKDSQVVKAMRWHGRFSWHLEKEAETSYPSEWALLGERDSR